MAAVIWTPRADADLAAIEAYFAEVRHSPAYAASLTRKIFQAADRLETFPQSGRVVPEIGDETLREVVFHNYRIVYLY